MIASWRDGAGSFTRIRSNYFRSVWRRGWKGVAGWTSPLLLNASLDSSRPTKLFLPPRYFFFLFRSRAQTDSLADLYQIFPNTLKRLYERKKVNIILYARFRTIRDIAGTSSCVILHSLNSKILILMKNERHEGNFISRDPREVSFLPPPSRNFPSSQSYKNTFVKMYMG